MSSNFDNGFKKAQRDYDNQLPPDDAPNGFIECEECEGQGVIVDVNTGDVHACKTCNGEGEVPRPTISRRRDVEPDDIESVDFD